ncbi:hypothetical protein [Synechococcus sp. M16CYN]|uniref:hypothetical protein n=1 Tax=Synechococcus sp. M16CYN TaxID=3103139 RepID=UPI00333F33B0
MGTAFGPWSCTATELSLLAGIPRTGPLSSKRLISCGARAMLFRYPLESIASDRQKSGAVTYDSIFSLILRILAAF